jgi:lipoyl(octanoyl) transferase
MNKTIEYIDWGLKDYNKAWEEQERLFASILTLKQNNQPTSNYLVFCEHPHVYTLGKSGDEQNLLLNYIQLQAQHASFVQTNRGGDITYHGPGQLVGYPIFDLANFNIGLRQYIEIIEDSIIELLALYGLRGERMSGATGVWLDAFTPHARKMCAIGVRSSRYVTMHGFALNISTDLSYFSHINPCGFTDKGVSSLSHETGRDIAIDTVKQELHEIIEKKFTA